MNSKLLQYLRDTFSKGYYDSFKHNDRLNFIQIDDQEENEDITNFCNIFLILEASHKLKLELVGKIPISNKIKDLCEIYSGTYDTKKGRIALPFTLNNLDVVLDLASLIKQTKNDGHLVLNPEWNTIAERTSASIKRFVRSIHEFIGYNI